ncbi:hypothetical protein BDW59DRAFT_166857 [Aspergillus cavernicola]|uniref:L-ornithine N(5)-oxygenase n=1 Tax=Aspergillus cavernicola TaxID=176166 RepID=A0ABR4HIE9_9EURO
MSDTESFLYRFSFDHDDLVNYPWSHRYVTQEEILRYLNHVADEYDLRQYMQFETELLSADWCEEEAAWKIQTTNGAFVARYLVTALGLLSKQNFPDIPGLASFQGQLTHTASWKEDIVLKDKRVAVIGCRSTGTQVVKAIADEARSLHVFVRHPQYSVPSGNKPITPEYRQDINNRYKEIWEQVRNSQVAFGFEEVTRPVISVSAEERVKVFEDLGLKAMDSDSCLAGSPS